MALSRSLLECGHDEVRDEDVTDICSYCATDGKSQPALHFCFDCGVYGRYLCGICLKNHNKFVNNHEVERIENKSISRRSKINDSKVKDLERSNGELQKDKNVLQKEKAELSVSIHHVKKENEKLTKTFHECIVENEGLKTKIGEFESKSNETENRLIDMVKEKDDLISRSKINDSKVKDLERSNGELQKDKNVLQKEKAELLVCIHAFKKENEKLTKEFHDCKEENNELKKKIEEFESKSNETENRLMDIVKERDDLTLRLRENHTKVKSLMKSNENLQSDKNSLEMERVELRTTVNQLKKENENLSKELHHYNGGKTDDAMTEGAPKQESGCELRVKENRHNEHSAVMCAGGSSITTKNKPVAVAIVIRNTSSAYAFSFLNKSNKEIIVYNGWKDTHGLHSYENSTAALFDKNKKFNKFGYEAEIQYADLAKDDKHHEWYFFRSFMLKLQEKEIDLNYEIVDDKGKKMKAIDVLSGVIKYLKDECFRNMERRNSTIQMRDFQWVVSIPAMWTDTANQIMREAAYLAGIERNDLTLVSEPVAASLYCQMLPAKKVRCSNTSLPYACINSPGTKFMVIDLEDYSANFTIFKRESKDVLIEVMASTVEACGINMVEMEFVEFISNFKGNTSYQKWIDECQDDYSYWLRDFRLKIKTIDFSKHCLVTFRLPPSFRETFEEMNHTTIKQAIERSQLKGKIRSFENIIRMDANAIKEIIKPYTDKVVGYIQYLLTDQDVYGTSIFLMVGQFSQSSMLQEAIIKTFATVNVIIPEDEQFAVLKGAVMYGHQS